LAIASEIELVTNQFCAKKQYNKSLGETEEAHIVDNNYGNWEMDGGNRFWMLN